MKCIGMKRLSLILFLTIVFESWAFSFTRVFFMDKELKNASLIKEIIIHGYTSRIDTLPNQEPIGIEKVINEMTFSVVDKPDILLKYKPPYTGSVNQTAYYDIKQKDNYKSMIPPEGYWPSIGDTVLVVFDSSNHVILFAEIIDTSTTVEYQFWSPYHTSSWNTQFFISSPFRPVKTNDTGKIWEHLQEMAKERGYEFASQFYCSINKNDLWQYLDEIRKK